MYDAIVVGARCAGSSTAMLMARRGLRVLVVDRAHPSTGRVPPIGNIVGAGALLLRDWGLLDRLVDTGCPPVGAMRIHSDGGTVELPTARPGGVEAMYVAEHAVLDPLLCDAAVEAGAEVRLDVRVTGLKWEDGRVTGIVGVGIDGETIAERAPLVVGADGKQSFVARAVGATAYRVRPAGTCAFLGIYAATGHHDIEIHLGDRRQCIAFPTHHGRTWVIAARTVEEWDRYRSDPERGYHQQLEEVAPGLAATVRRCRRVGRLAGTADLDGFFRPASGSGWALVGDAGHTKDPGPGRGISDAFLQADLLAEAVDGAVRGATTWDEALERYARVRDEVSTEIYDLTHDLADQPPPDVAGGLSMLLEDAAGRQLSWLIDRVATVPAPTDVADRRPSDVARQNGTRVLGRLASPASRRR